MSARYVPEHLRDLAPAVRDEIVRVAAEQHRLNPPPPLDDAMKARLRNLLHPAASRADAS